MQNFDFISTHILAFLSVRTDMGTNIVFIVNGPSIKSSIIVFDNDMRRKLLSEFDGVRITAVADIVYEGHLFAINDDNNLIAMNLKHLCEGCAPYQDKDLNKHEGGTILSIEQKHIVIAHASGEIQKILKSPFAGIVQLE